LKDGYDGVTGATVPDSRVSWATGVLGVFNEFVLMNCVVKLHNVSRRGACYYQSSVACS